MYVGRVCQVLNNTRCRATGFSPNHLHLGLVPSAAFPDIFNLLSDSPPKSRSQFIKDRVKEIEVARDIAFRYNEQYYQTEDQQWEKSHVSRLQRDHNFVPGEFVLVKRLARTGQNVQKLSGMPLLGPAIIRRLVGKKAILIEYVANGQVRIRNYKHLVRFHEPPPNCEDQRYYNGPLDKTSRDEQKYPMLDILTGISDERDDFDEKQIEYVKHPTKIDLNKIKNEVLQEEEEQDISDNINIYELDDRENDEYEDEFHELDHEPIDNLLLPYTEVVEEDPRDPTELSEDMKALLHPQVTTDVELIDDQEEKSVHIDETFNTMKIIPGRDVLMDHDRNHEDIIANVPDIAETNEETGPHSDLPHPTEETETRRRSPRNRPRHDYNKLHRKGLHSIYSLLW